MNARTRRRAVAASVIALVLAGCADDRPGQVPAELNSARAIESDTFTPSISSSSATPPEANDAASADPNLTQAALKPVGHPPHKTQWGNHWGVGQLTAVSKDEVWAALVDEWFRFRKGSWQPVGIGSDCTPVPASDGAVWMLTAAGLTRVKGERRHVVAPEIRREQFT